MTKYMVSYNDNSKIFSAKSKEAAWAMALLWAKLNGYPKNEIVLESL